MAFVRWDFFKGLKAFVAVILFSPRFVAVILFSPRSWQGHATIIAGRFGSGKSVALEEALRDRRGVYVHFVKDKDWENSLYKDLRLDNLGMLKDALRLVRKRNHGSTPILVLDIPRTTKEGATSATLVVLCLIRLGAGMDTERQDNFWVGDLTKDEAEKLLELHGQEDRKDEFLDACGYNAMDLVRTCQRYAEVGEEALQAKKADMDKKARKEVLRFKDQCKIAGDTGKEILAELLANRQAGKGADELCTPASPKDVAMWIRERGYHPVIWHTVKREYQFASELHANAATEILKSTSQSTPELAKKKGVTLSAVLGVCKKQDL
eukprot:s12819_g1.t1